MLVILSPTPLYSELALPLVSMRLCLAKSAEKQQPLPGDPLVSKPKVTSTHGISLKVGAEQVWPWLVQMGQQKGGFYSYSTLENLIGCKIQNANRIHLEWQSLSIGDRVSLHPSAAPMYVKEIVENRHLVLAQERPVHWSWSFVLIPQKENGCRLLVRTRVAWRKYLHGLVLIPGVRIGHYLMERKMLLGIKQRCENSGPGSASTP